MRALTIAVLAATLGFVELGLTPATASGESLAEIAARERARRKGTTDTTVITDEDLANSARRGHTGNLGQPDTTQTTEAAESSGGATASGEKSESELREERAKAWRERNQKAEEEVTRLNTEIEKLQTELNDRRVYQYGPGRTSRLQRLEQAKAELEIAQQKVDDLEEERRREGF